MYVRPDEASCTHCQLPAIGSAYVWTNAGRHQLCHPDRGLDCYQLVTVQGHQLVDCSCRHVDVGEYDALQV